ncbi:hypothetical protein M8J76_006988 [Diaphorina citri]|nr:hypothetical protein M8J76_006988 [Diaphorina citri]
MQSSFYQNSGLEEREMDALIEEVDVETQGCLEPQRTNSHNSGVIERTDQSRQRDVMSSFWTSPVDSDTKDVTVLFIRLRVKWRHLFDGAKLKQVKAWEMLAQKLSREGFPVPASTSAEAGKKCKVKWDSLIRVFQDYRKHQMTTGAATKKPPKYLQEMEEATGDFHHINLQVLEDSFDTLICPTQQSSTSISNPQPSTSQPSTSTSEPSTSTSQPSTSTPQPSTSNPQPSSFTSQPSTSTPQPSTSNPQPSSSTSQPSTSNPQPSTSNPQEREMDALIEEVDVETQGCVEPQRTANFLAPEMKNVDCKVIQGRVF